jgi:hypothetical protein
MTSFRLAEMNQRLETRDSPSSNVEMNAKLATETSMNFYRTALRHIPQDSTLQRLYKLTNPTMRSPCNENTAESTLYGAHGCGNNEIPFNTSYGI